MRVCFLLLLLQGAFQAARADEFSIVPAGDPLYRQLAVVGKAAWAGAPAARGSNSTLTRYEIALETAKSIIAVSARQEAGAKWNAASKPALRALRELSVALRPELQALGVDVAATLRLLDGLLKPAPNRSFALVPQDTTDSIRRASPNGANRSLPGDEATPAAFGDVSGGNGRRGFSQRESAPLSLSLSQRLRLTAALSGLERDALDPFSNSTVGLRRPQFSGARSSFAALPLAASSDEATGFGAGVSLDVNDRLRLRAGFNRRALEPSAGLQNIWSPGARSSRALGGGLDIGLFSGLRLAGDVENLQTDAQGAPSWTRLSGGLGLSAWQNRLSLKVNLSRLVPDDVQVLPSTVAGLNVDLNMTERLSLTMLYQQLFSAPTPDRADRLVGGGISIKF